MEEDKTTIQIQKQTAERLCQIGRKGETYDGMISHLLAPKPFRESATPPPLITASDGEVVAIPVNVGVRRFELRSIPNTQTKLGNSE